MTTETAQTLQYYANKATDFANDTQTVNFSHIQQAFLEHIPTGGSILDLGCGAGRDSKAFIDAGYQVTAMDGSVELCDIASKFIHQNVICASFKDFETNQTFDGIWACASLLHVSRAELTAILPKLVNMLKPNGYFYLSFKYGDFSGMRNGRFFTDLTEDSFKVLIQDIPNIEINQIVITDDVRPDRQNEKWLNAYIIKR